MEVIEDMARKVLCEGRNLKAGFRAYTLEELGLLAGEFHEPLATLVRCHVSTPKQCTLPRLFSAGSGRMFSARIVTSVRASILWGVQPPVYQRYRPFSQWRVD